ncbi:MULTISPECIES: DUF4328 domain-containing protein [Saccharothrix]|uniref:DUF4328 domain-containing protein n=1 Tax=Saccharothrix TaxID=2071 RepID=UPI000940206A|nr:DUF4328 domain-containing protein [Saccharothrix sp. CB00851]OKI31256.1 hypothetical protein A6A25_27575 [Saccharothrix sp. CB00851]
MPYTAPYAAMPEPRRWENVTSLRVPLVALLGLDSVLALLMTVAPLALVAFILLSLATVVVFLVWLQRARRNAASGRHQFPPGMVFGGWFVPFANFYIPLRVVLDTGWAAAQPGRRGAVAGPVVVWWVFWVLSWLTAFEVTMRERVTAAGSASELYFGVNLGATWLNTVCLAVAAAALAVVVHRITVDQERAVSALR